MTWWGGEMPLQNRVDPFGELFADPARGLFMGNRGGRIHRDDRTLSSRRFASRQWICCVLDFKGRQREVWGTGYTELFFLDEVTAFAAGHRPCFECRRADANAFAEAWAMASRLRTPPRAPAMDSILHVQRLDGRVKKRHRLPVGDLPDGAVIARGEGAFAIRGGSLLRWTPAGYEAAQPRPRRGTAEVLTPPVILSVLARGYEPQWHESAAIVVPAPASTRPRRSQR
jgi:hypothetical protein